MTVESKNPETLALHAGHRTDPTTGAVAVPIYQTTSYQFQNTEHASNLFALKELGNIYTRIMNPTCDALEQRVTALEGGVAALALSSGQAASAFALQNLAKAGDNVVSSTDLYGGTWNLFANTLKDQGIEITRKLEAPLVAYMGDTEPGPPLVRTDVRTAQVVISECTFVEEEHRSRAKIGKHLHIRDVVEWLRVLECEKLVLIHVSRRSNLSQARKRLIELAGEEEAERVIFLMDHRSNRARYERQLEEAEKGNAS